MLRLPLGRQRHGKFCGECAVAQCVRECVCVRVPTCKGGKPEKNLSSREAPKRSREKQAFWSCYPFPKSLLKRFLVLLPSMKMQRAAAPSF